ncbi:MAG: trehalase family glycosidase [Candidatus Aminicenantaceae bacterium]
MKRFKLKVGLILLLFCFHTTILAEIFYPWKDVYIGALEGKSWFGLVLAPQTDCAFSFRFRVKKDESLADSEELFYLISEVGPHSPDGQYSRLKVDLGLPFSEKENTPILRKPSLRKDTMVLEWSRQDERIVIGKIVVPDNIDLHMIHYFPWDTQGEYSILSDNQIGGESRSAKKFYYLLWTNRSGNTNRVTQVSELVIPYALQKDNALYFAAGVGEDLDILSDQIYRYKNARLIDSILKQEKSRYEKSRVKIDGLYQGAAKSITNNLFWSLLYQPGKHRIYTPPSRSGWLSRPEENQDHWTIFEWNSFFNALEVSIESFKHAGEIVASVLETQYPNGNIPNWRSRLDGTPDRSQPPIGSYIVLKLFQKNKDMELLEYAFPFLKKWHSFWLAKKENGQARRDGNGDGLLEWGSDNKLVSENDKGGNDEANGALRAKLESGQEDLPNWDGVEYSNRSNTLVMNCLDLNSLYTLDAWCLSQIANILDYREDYDTFLREYEYMKQRVDEYFWDEKEGFYFDRYWNGNFSTRKAASNFYPLLARIPDEKKAAQMKMHLLDDSEFWGDYVIPTISRDDPAFRRNQQSWRGTISPPTNYLVYQGLKAYGFDTVASEFAKKSEFIFMRSWKNFQISPENYDSRTGEAAGRRYLSWGPLFSLIAVEEYLDITPWDGFRFGMIDPERRGRLSRISIQERHYDVEISRKKMRLLEEGKTILETNGGAVFRQFIYSENEISFDFKSLKKRKINIRFLVKGRYQLLVDDLDKGIFAGKQIKFKIPAGEHSVHILLLEKVE